MDNGKQALTPRPDELQQLLKARIRKQRPSKWKAAVLLTILFAVPLGLFIWIFWPAPQLPRALIVAPDVLVVGDEEPTLHAVILAEEAAAQLAGWPVVFQQGDGSSQPAWQVEAKTDANGEVSSRIADTAGMFCAIYAPRHRKRRAVDLGRAFRYSRDETPLFVAADTLADGSPVTWRKNIFDIPPRKAAARVLAQLVSDAKLRVVYFTAHVSDPRIYLKIRNWLRRAPDPGEVRFPDGPVLPVAPMTAGESGEAVLAFGQTYRNKFSGPPLAVAADGKTAQALQKAGWSVVVLRAEGREEGNLPKVRGWNEVPDWVRRARNLPDREGK